MIWRHATILAGVAGLMLVPAAYAFQEWTPEVVEGQIRTLIDRVDKIVWEVGGLDSRVVALEATMAAQAIPTSHTLSGTFEILGEFVNPGEGAGIWLQSNRDAYLCSVYADGVVLGPGNPVRILDGSGAIIAVAHLGDGPHMDASMIPHPERPTCEFSFTTEAPDAAIYEFVVGDRDALAPVSSDQIFSKADMVEVGWNVDLGVYQIESE